MSYCSFAGGEEYTNHFQPGIYVCADCSHELFSSSSKFQHSSPWPAFSQTIHPDSVSKHPEYGLHNSDNIVVCCGKCGNGLGHEFLYDVFSSSLKFIPKRKAIKFFVCH
uniref:MsrB domain-containing protein n=1 Tax=Periophthalmus magnuspinnatus TaxID=409849 RepID=A0A3B4B979_9GOBI